MSRFDEVVARLRDPGAYPHRPSSVDVRETAISMVFIAGDRVFKVKKPVTLPFLDYADAQRRRTLCHEEAFRRREERQAFLDALDGAASPVVFVECRAARTDLLERARAREADPDGVSDATAAMVDRQLAEWQPLDELPAAQHLSVRADRCPQETIDDLEALLDGRLARGRD